jgi:hypothetical protein
MHETYYECAIPNYEVKSLYCSIIKNWLGNGQSKRYENFLACLLAGNIEQFIQGLSQILLQTISVHDTAHKPEAFYHGFFLGLAAGLDKDRYELKSNRESGYGRYDIAIIPKDILQPVIILELKSARSSSAADLKQEAQTALEQINQKQYVAEVQQRGCTQIIKLGIAFCGKEFRVAFDTLQ